MNNTKSNSITTSELEHLLALAALNLDLKQAKNAEIMEVIASKTFTGNSNWFYSLKAALLISTLAGIVSILSWYFVPLTTEKISTGRSSKALSSAQSIAPVISKSDLRPGLLSSLKEPARPISIAERNAVNSTLSNQLSTTESQRSDNYSNPQEIEAMISDTVRSHKTDAYVFPVLTEKEQKNNEKNKKQILKYLSKINIYQYPKIPVAGVAENYFIKATEVSNKEYRTFLFDLLIKGRKEEFLQAKPEQSLWTNAAGQTAFKDMAKTYFSDKKYDDFPVVNITQVGAELYCKWLMEELNVQRASDSKIAKLEIRLPNQTEWLYAAKAGRPGAKYSWPHDSVQNLANCFMANCCLQKLKEEIRYPICNNHHKTDTSCYTTAGMMLRDSSVATVLVWSYNPNAYGLYTMCGNVSELVYSDDAKSTKALGGNWASDFKHLMLDSESEFTINPGASPMIGFRILVKKNPN